MNSTSPCKVNTETIRRWVWTSNELDLLNSRICPLQVRLSIGITFSNSRAIRLRLLDIPSSRSTPTMTCAADRRTRNLKFEQIFSRQQFEHHLRTGKHENESRNLSLKTLSGMLKGVSNEAPLKSNRNLFICRMNRKWDLVRRPSVQVLGLVFVILFVEHKKTLSKAVFRNILYITEQKL